MTDQPTTTAPEPTPYRVLITGSRNWTAHDIVRRALDEMLATAPYGQPVVIVHGDCPTGADLVAHVWATTWCGDDRVSEEPHPAAWHLHGRAAGPIRNKAMVDRGAGLCLAFIKDGSRGASHTARLAEAAAIPTRRWTA